MWEQSKAAKRRFYDGLFHARYFVGRGIDIGGGPEVTELIRLHRREILRKPRYDVVEEQEIGVRVTEE